MSELLFPWLHVHVFVYFSVSRPSALCFVGSVLREQRETDQQRHPGSLISRRGSAGAELGAGGSVPGDQTAGGL